MDQAIFINSAQREVRIIGLISEWDEASYRNVRREMEAMLVEGGSVTFRINSDGGVVKEGLALYDLINSAPVQTIGIVEGMAASTAGWLLQACNVRKATPNSFMMVHRIEGCGCGTTDDMREVADHGDKLEDKVRNIFAGRTGKTRAEVDSWFDGKKATYFDMEEALEAGLIDEILTPELQVAATNRQVASFTNHKSNMDFQNQLAEKLGTQEKDPAKLLNLVSGLKEQASTADKRAQDAEAQVATLKNDLKALRDKQEEDAKALRDKATKLVNDAHERNLLDDTQRDAWLNLVEHGAQSVIDLVAGLQPAKGGKSLGDDLKNQQRKGASPEQPQSYANSVGSYLREKHGDQPK